MYVLVLYDILKVTQLRWRHWTNIGMSWTATWATIQASLPQLCWFSRNLFIHQLSSAHLCISRFNLEPMCVTSVPFSMLHFPFPQRPHLPWASTGRQSCHVLVTLTKVPACDLLWTRLFHLTERRPCNKQDGQNQGQHVARFYSPKTWTLKHLWLFFLTHKTTLHVKIVVVPIPE